MPSQPNNLFFDEFLYEDGQLSFRISVLDTGRKAKKDGAAESSPILENASGVAQAVYKRRKDIQTLAGVRVDETGIGSGQVGMVGVGWKAWDGSELGRDRNLIGIGEVPSGSPNLTLPRPQDVVPVERSRRDWLFMPIMAVCALTISTLVAVLAVNLVRMRQRRRDTPVLPQVLPGKKASETAQEGPHGVAVIGARSGGDRSKHSSTSSWPDESATPQGPTSQQLDIGTGHVLLAFLKEHLDKPGQIAREWESVKDYANAGGETRTAERPENAARNADPQVVPCEWEMMQRQEM